MNRNFQHMVTRYLRQYKRNRSHRAFVAILSCFVLCITIGLLVLPGISMEADTYCGKEAHTHSDECYGLELICPEATAETQSAHVHTDACWSEEKTLTCTLEETAGHTHSEACGEPQSVLVCGLEENEAHTHSDTCYAISGEYGCGLEETPGHIHSEECYTTSTVLVCGQDTAETGSTAHVHDESCYAETLLCQLEEHEHDVSCFSDPNADLETAESWEKTLPEALTGLWGKDLASVAQSQLGYQESSNNYAVTDGEKQGYNRYGAWAGTPYAEWNALFVSFCLEYAGVPEGAMPRSSDSQLWMAALAETEQLESVSYLPLPGDLIFLDRSGVTRVGIVTSASEDGSTVEAILGDCDGSVQQYSYGADNEAILGYGVMPDNSAMVLAEGDTYTVWVDPTNGSNPFYKGVSLVKHENIAYSDTITLPTADDIGNPTGYNYKVRGWYAITGKEDTTDESGNLVEVQRYYQPGEAVSITANTIFYADWVPVTYDIGEYIEGHSVESRDTSDFVTVKMFDYNDLVNLNTAKLDTSRADGSNSETWTALDYKKSLLLPLNTWRSSENTLDCPAVPENAVDGVYRGHSSNGQGYITKELFDYASIYFDELGESLGVNYVGPGNYLFQYSEEKGYYYFDSHLNGAAYNQSEDRFYIYDAPSKTSCTDTSGKESQGDFLPFNLEHGTGIVVDHDGTGNGNDEYEKLPDANYWFGMEITIDFYLPDTPRTGGGSENIAVRNNPMVFYFTGDDDVWVFVDGELVLDMGGIHEPVSGFINFDNGRVCTTDSSGTQVDTTLDALIPGFSSGEHKLEMFYMERGGGLSNCEIYFNLPARQNLQINKVDRQHPDASMDGTEFTVYADEACTALATDLYSDPERTVECSTFTIDSTNQDTLYGFYCNKYYYIKETKAPDGYEHPDRVLKVMFDYSGKMTVETLPENTLPGYDGNIYDFVDDDDTTNDNLGIVTVFNAKTRNDLTLRKIWYSSDGTVDTGKTDAVTVDVYRTTDKEATLESLSDTDLYQEGISISDLTDDVLTNVLKDVDQYDNDGNLYYYFIKEQTVSGYVPTYIDNGTIAGGTITVANAPGTPVEYEKPTFTLTKTDDSGNLLPGAVFRLYEYSHTAGNYIWVADYTVGSDGTITFHDELSYNTAYYLQELQAPTGYLKNPELHYFGIANNDTVLYPTAAPSGFQWSETNQQGEYGTTVVNYGNPSITLEKVDASDHEIKLSGARFALYKYNGTDWVSIDIGLTTGEDGKLKLEGLAYNTCYKIVETTAPDGYFLSAEPIVFQIPAPEGHGFAPTATPSGETVIDLSSGETVVVENEKIPTLSVVKEWYEKDDEGNTTLVEDSSGYDPVQFVLYRRAEYSAVQDGQKTVSFDLQAWGTHLYASESFPAGTTVTVELEQHNVDSWMVNGTPEFEANGSAITYTDQKTPIEDSNDKYNRKCTFVLSEITEDILITGNLQWDISTWIGPVCIPEYPETGETPEPEDMLIYTGTLSESNSWRYDCLMDLKASEQVEIEGNMYLATYTYYVVETPIPDGYDATYSNNPLSLNSQNKIITIKNTPNDKKLTTLTIEKVDSDDSNLKLPGAKFTLYKWDTSLSDWVSVKTLTTGDNGKLTFRSLSYNTAYKLEEIEAPTGYSVSDDSPRYFFFEEADTDAYPVSRPEDEEEISYSSDPSVQISNPKQPVSLTVKKIYPNIDGEKPEVTFELHRKAVVGDQIYELENSRVGTTTYVLGEPDWKVDIYDLEASGKEVINGTEVDAAYVYYVVETPVPDGFSVTYSEDIKPGEGAVITITNTLIPTFELPETGGTVAELYALGGLLTYASAVMLAKKKRRHKP